MKMEKNALLLGRVFGIPIKVSQTLLIMLPVMALLYYRSNFLLGLIIVIGIFASVALHELGHSVVAMRFGCQVREIELGILGGAAKMSHIPTQPRQEILIALAGPAVSLGLGLLGILSRSELFFSLGAINLFLCGFNLLPCFPMDGGRVLRAALAAKKGRMEATRLAAKIGKYFCILFVLYGLLNMHLILAMIGGYIYFAGQQELRMVMMEHQADRFNGFSRDDNIDVEVSPPPYAQGSNSSSNSILDRLKKIFSGKA